MKSCPALPCGRTKIDLIGLANQVEEMVQDIPLDDIKVAVMGCVVNGPGGSKRGRYRHCPGGIGEGLLIKKGEIIKKVKRRRVIGNIKTGAAALE